MSDSPTVVDDTALLDRVQAPEGEGREILDAATREVIGRVPVQTTDDVDAAVAHAKAAQPGWEALGHEKRSELLLAAADAIDARGCTRSTRRSVPWSPRATSTPRPC